MRIFKTVQKRLPFIRGQPSALHFKKLRNGGAFMHYNIIETGKRIKELRRKRGLTQKKLAEMIGMAPNSIAKIENGVVGASIDALLIMCQILNTDLDCAYWRGNQR